MADIVSFLLFTYLFVIIFVDKSKQVLMWF